MSFSTLPCRLIPFSPFSALPSIEEAPEEVGDSLPFTLPPEEGTAAALLVVSMARAGVGVGLRLPLLLSLTLRDGVVRREVGKRRRPLSVCVCVYVGVGCMGRGGC